MATIDTRRPTFIALKLWPQGTALHAEEKAGNSDLFYSFLVAGAGSILCDSMQGADYPAMLMSGGCGLCLSNLAQQHLEAKSGAAIHFSSWHQGSRSIIFWQEPILIHGLTTFVTKIQSWWAFFTRLVGLFSK